MKTVNELKAMTVEQLIQEQGKANKMCGDYATMVEEVIVEKETTSQEGITVLVGNKYDFKIKTVGGELYITKMEKTGKITGASGLPKDIKVIVEGMLQ